jgi:hypothetical protein
VLVASRTKGEQVKALNELLGQARDRPHPQPLPAPPHMMTGTIREFKPYAQNVAQRSHVFDWQLPNTSFGRDSRLLRPNRLSSARARRASRG